MSHEHRRYAGEQRSEELDRKVGIDHGVRTLLDLPDPGHCALALMLGERSQNRGLRHRARDSAALHDRNLRDPMLLHHGARLIERRCSLDRVDRARHDVLCREPRHQRALLLVQVGLDPPDELVGRADLTAFDAGERRIAPPDRLGECGKRKAKRSTPFADLRKRIHDPRSGPCRMALSVLADSGLRQENYIPLATLLRR